MAAQCTAAPTIDRGYLLGLLERLLAVPRPTGHTAAVADLLADELARLGLTVRRTRRGVLLADLPAHQATAGPPDAAPTVRAVAAHADVIGCIVRRVKDNGRLEVTSVGTFSARFADGARVRVLTDDPAQVITGTVLPLLASGHRFGDEVDRQPVDWDHVEVRLDERVSCAAEVTGLGVHVGDLIALDAEPVITPAGFINARGLDDTAGLAAMFAAVQALTAAGRAPAAPSRVVVTMAEEVGQGWTDAIGQDVAELVTVDNAVVAPGQASREDAVTVALGNLIGPLDRGLSRRLLDLAAAHDIPAERDVFRYYRCDADAAVEAGADCEVALIGCGVDASHGWERTHVEGIIAVADLLLAYLQDDAGGLGGSA